ncbi:MAG TPA: hypothetical protein VGH58_11915 [Solirubrobacterales bacterium]|jgi:hypothetical protein
MIPRAKFLAALFLVAIAPVAAVAILAIPASAAPQDFGLASVDASLSTTQAGGHPDLTFSFDTKRNASSPTNPAGEHDGFAATRDVRIELPPGLIGDPNVVGVSQQCTLGELATYNLPGGGCPNGSQVGVTEVSTFEVGRLLEPVYMMTPPGGDVVARLGFVAGIFPTFIDLRVRSEGDYGIVADITDASPAARLLKAETTTWGVPADPSHDTERCTPAETLFGGCAVSPKRPPGGRALPFLTNPTRCGVPLEMRVSASSWVEPERFDTKSASFPEISGCNHLPFGPSLEVKPTSHRAAAPTGLDMTIRLPASEGVKVLEPAETRAIRIDLPKGLAVNAGSADGLATCSPAQVRFEERVAAECPDASKLADTEFDIPVLERNLRGAIYLREPEPKNPFRIWIVADDLGLHVKLPGQLHVDEKTGQIESIVIGAPKTEGIPQAPLREVKLEFKSGFRAPLVNPQSCGTYATTYEFVPWSGGPPATGSTTMKIDEGCNTGGFNPKLSAGSLDPVAGRHSPFLFTLSREDGEQNPQGLDVSLPTGFAATFAGVPRCEGAAATTGRCPPGSRIGKVVAAVGAGPAPLWVPQPGARPTAVYLSGPYKGAPTSIVAVVPRQAGPFDFGDEVVRSAVYVDPTTARATAKTDPLPQLIEGIPVTYRTINVQLDRPGFTLNPTSCAQKQTEAMLTSSRGAGANPSSPFEAVNCAKLSFKPALSIRLFGATRRGGLPRLRAVVKMPAGGANIAATSVALPHSEFLDQAHIKTVCTRVQFAAHQCPPGSVYGNAVVKTPLLDEPLEGPVILRSSSHSLPDLVIALKGPPSLPIEINADARVDSVNGGIRTSFESIPDAPVETIVFNMQGGKKGLLENSTDLCADTHRATAKFRGQNGKEATLRPVMKVSCGAKH